MTGDITGPVGECDDSESHLGEPRDGAGHLRMGWQGFHLTDDLCCGFVTEIDVVGRGDSHQRSLAKLAERTMSVEFVGQQRSVQHPEKPLSSRRVGTEGRLHPIPNWLKGEQRLVHVEYDEVGPGDHQAVGRVRTTAASASYVRSPMCLSSSSRRLAMTLRVHSIRGRLRSPVCARVRITEG